MERFARFRFAPVAPLGAGGRRATASPRHLAVSKEAATEGTVLLKNDGILPLKKGVNVCLFGRGAGEFIFGGGGSGKVVSDIQISLADALQNAADRGEIGFFKPLVDHAKEGSRKIIREGKEKYPDYMDFRVWNTHRSLEPIPMPEELYRAAVEFGDVAILAIVRFSAEGTNEGDRPLKEFALYESEIELMKKLKKDFGKVVVVLNVCGAIGLKEFRDDDGVGAILYPLYGGSFAGEALVDLLFGKAYPSGHLQHTLAEKIEDYPSTETYIESNDYVNYTEDIFVGYRYFETFAPEKVVYPFGYGLGYTDFSIVCEDAKKEKNTVSCRVTVTNTGSFAGKEVVQMYLSAPQGVLGKPKKELAAFRKTRELKPGESQSFLLKFDIRSLASFDDLGKIEKSAFLLEAGEYSVFVGNNVRDAEKIFSYELKDTVTVRRLHSYLAPESLPERLTADGTMEKLPSTPKTKHAPRQYRLKAKPASGPLTLAQALDSGRTEEFLASLTDEELVSFLYGHPPINAAQTGYIGAILPNRGFQGSADKKGIPPVPTADGPAGYRTTAGSGISTTYFPCANTVSQSWNLALAEKCGRTGALEVKENNAGIWLTPAMNIHRSPLCGRNFEYFSEDPVATGHFGAATVKGVQSQKIAATIKHFCCNNKEYNRKLSDSRVSERALRELYLRGFEIAVKKSDPWCVMTSYNKVNGIHAASNWELINGILKGEWNYRGLVMTDWHTYTLVEDDLHGGNDVKMPYKITKHPKAPCGTEKEYSLLDMLHEGTLSRGAVLEAVRRVLVLMSHFE